MLSLFMMLSSHDLMTFITETGKICNNTNINALHMPSDLYIFEVAANQNKFHHSAFLYCIKRHE